MSTCVGENSVCTWEKGSSSELGKSYWLRSFALKTTGPWWWGPPDDRGNTFCFFSYFLFCRGTSDFSGWRWKAQVRDKTWEKPLKTGKILTQVYLNYCFHILFCLPVSPWTCSPWGPCGPGVGTGWWEGPGEWSVASPAPAQPTPLPSPPHRSLTWHFWEGEGKNNEQSKLNSCNCSLFLVLNLTQTICLQTLPWWSAFLHFKVSFFTFLTF